VNVDVAIDSGPYPIWRRMRHEAPVRRDGRHDVRAPSRSDDVEAAYEDTATFSSAHGTVLQTMSPDLVGGGRGPTIFTDPPGHTQLRALVSRVFTTRHVSALAARIRELCDELFASVEGRDAFDLAHSERLHTSTVRGWSQIRFSPVRAR